MLLLGAVPIDVSILGVFVSFVGSVYALFAIAAVGSVGVAVHIIIVEVGVVTTTFC